MSYLVILPIILISIIAHSKAEITLDEFRDGILLAENPYAKVKKATLPPSQIFGRASRGCFSGGEQLLAKKEDNFFVSNLKTRNTNWAHPKTVERAKELAKLVKGKCKLVFRDLSQPRGGPALHRHNTHQSGVDIDVEFSCLQKSDRPKLENRGESTPSVDKAVKTRNGDYEHFRTVFTSHIQLQREKKRYWKLTGRNLEKDLMKSGQDIILWDERMTEVLRAAAEASWSERIIVNPVVKHFICDNVLLKETGKKKEDLKEEEIEKVFKANPWLIKLRVSRGHVAHFHLRMACPKDSEHCSESPLKPYPESVAGTGCIGIQRDFYEKDSKIIGSEIPKDVEKRKEWLTKKDSWLADLINSRLDTEMETENINGPDSVEQRKRFKEITIEWLKTKLDALPEQCSGLLDNK